MVFDRGTGRVCLDRLDALLGIRLRLVSLAGSDNLAVRGFQVKPELTGVVFADFELGRHHISFGRVVPNGHHRNPTSA
jgi:hypothetical protein